MLVGIFYSSLQLVVVDTRHLRSHIQLLIGPWVTSTAIHLTYASRCTVRRVYLFCKARLRVSPLIQARSTTSHFYFVGTKRQLIHPSPPTSFSTTSFPLPTPSIMSQSPSDDHSVPPDDLQTSQYISSVLVHPPTSLCNSSARAQFILALLGDTSLAKDAEDDAALLSQLETRTTLLLSHISSVLPSLPPQDADLLIALITTLATDWHILLDAFEKAGASLLVLNFIRNHINDPALVSRALAALRAFTMNEPMRKRCMVDGAIQLTLQVMERHHQDLRVQDRAVSVIANVAFGCTHRKRRIARWGATRKIVAAMNRWATEENLLVRAMLTIRNLTHAAQVNQYIAGNEGAVEAIARVLTNGKGNASVRFQALLALESLCRDDERNRKRLIEVERVAGGWLSLPGGDSVSDFDSVPSRVSGVEEEEELNEDGDVVVDEEEILVVGLTTKFQHGAALFPGRSADELTTGLVGEKEELFGTKKPETITENDEQVKQNAVGNSAAGMEGEKETLDEKRKKTPRKRTVMVAIIHAMRRDPDNVHLLEVGLSLLTRLCMHRSSMQLRIGELGGVQVAMAAMKRHNEVPTLIERACSLIRWLCVQQSNRNQVTSGILLLISAIRAHARNPDVVSEVAAALSNAVFEHEKNRRWAIAKGGCAAIVEAMDTCGGDNVIILEAGLCALRNLVGASYGGAVTATRNKAVGAAVSALDSTKEAASKGQCIVQEQAVMFLADVAKLAPKTLEEMADVDAGDWIENALARLAVETYPELHAVGDDLIDKINAQDKEQKEETGYGKTASETPLSEGIIRAKAGGSKGFFSPFSVPRWKEAKPGSLPRRRNTRRRSLHGEKAGQREPKMKRHSAAVVRNAVIL